MYMKHSTYNSFIRLSNLPQRQVMVCHHGCVAPPRYHSGPCYVLVSLGVVLVQTQRLVLLPHLFAEHLTLRYGGQLHCGKASHMSIPLGIYRAVQYRAYVIQMRLYCSLKLYILNVQILIIIPFSICICWRCIICTCSLEDSSVALHFDYDTTI